jgi:hypothetical protein
MKRLLILAAFASVALANTGCLMSPLGSDPNTRMNNLLNESENLRQVRDEWQRFWLVNHPSHLTPERVDGSIQ